MHRDTKVRIKQAIKKGARDTLSKEVLACILSLLVGEDGGRGDTWLPPHIHTAKRTTCLGGKEVILYNAAKMSVEEAMESDGYGTNVMVLEESQFNSFFTKP